MTIALIGLGLIGGSIGLDLAAAGHTVVGVDPDPDTQQAAQRLGIDTAGLHAAVDAADLVVIATPAGTIGEIVEQVAARTDAPITDVGSVCDPAALGLQSRPSTWIGGHPMAGTERSGFGAARRGLVVGAPWLLTPHDDVDRTGLQAVVELVLELQARPIVVTSEVHDQLVATVSHVPHLLAFALQQVGRDAGGDVVSALAGPSFRDATRVAASDPAFWADLLTRNHAAVRRAIDQVTAWLDASLDAPDAATLQTRLSAARRTPGPRQHTQARPEQVILAASDALERLREAGRRGRALTAVDTVNGAPAVQLAPPTHR